MPLRLAVSRHDSHGTHVIKDSTGVTHATIVYWEYWDIIRTAAEPKCSYHIQKSIETIDRLLSTKRLAHPIKALFGLPDLQHDEDFVSLLEASDLCMLRRSVLICDGGLTDPARILAGKMLGSGVWE